MSEMIVDSRTGFINWNDRKCGRTDRLYALYTETLTFSRRVGLAFLVFPGRSDLLIAWTTALL